MKGKTLYFGIVLWQCNFCPLKAFWKLLSYVMLGHMISKVAVVIYNSLFKFGCYCMLAKKKESNERT